MKVNVGPTDKIIRVVIGIVLLLLAFLFPMSQVLKIIFIVVGVISLLTSLTGFCLAYTLFGINTCKAKTEIKKS